jgi:hypothetical protein
VSVGVSLTGLWLGTNIFKMIIPRRSIRFQENGGIVQVSCGNPAAFLLELPTICLWTAGEIFAGAGVRSGFLDDSKFPTGLRWVLLLFFLGWTLFGIFGAQWLTRVYLRKSCFSLVEHQLAVSTRVFRWRRTRSYSIAAIDSAFSVPHRLGRAFDVFILHNGETIFVECALSKPDAKQLVDWVNEKLAVGK